ncbi:MAG: hypothetical protein RRY95_00535 [Oscillospiraceae bacterium]
MVFQSTDERLEIKLLAYEFPDAPDADADWLILQGRYTQSDGTVYKDSNSCLTATELQECNAGLKILAAGIATVYESDFQEPYFELTAQRQAEDLFQVTVAFTMFHIAADWDTAELEFTATTAQLKEWIAELDEGQKRFPPRG